VAKVPKKKRSNVPKQVDCTVFVPLITAIILLIVELLKKL